MITLDMLNDIFENLQYDMLDEIFNDLKTEILADVPQADMFNESLLKSKIKGACREVIMARNYPSTYTQDRIESDIMNYYSVIQDIARYDYNTVGSESLSIYSADGTSLRFIDRNKFFAGVYPIAR